MNFKEANILVTGGTGFLGHFVMEKFRKELGGKASVVSIGSKDFDLRNFREAEEATENVDLVIHLAADCGGIGYNRKNPGRLFYANMAMGMNIIEASRRNGVKKIVLIGSVCGYPKYTKVPFREEDLFLGYPEETNAPYGLAKRDLLVMAQGYRKQYGTNAIYLLVVNLYGPRDIGFYDEQRAHVVPAIIKKIADAKRDELESVELWGTGKPTREFLYVKDAADAIFLASKNYDKPMPINVGAGFEISIKELVNKTVEMLDYNGKIIWNSSYPDGQPRRCLDTDKAKELFHFEAETLFEDGLRNTIEWYLTARKKDDRL